MQVRQMPQNYYSSNVFQSTKLLSHYMRKFGNNYHCHSNVSLISTHQHKPYVAIVLNDFFHYLKGSTKDTQYVLDPFRILYSYFFAYFNIWTGLMCILFYFWTNIGHVYYLHCKIYCVCLIYGIFIDEKLDNEKIERIILINYLFIKSWISL